MRLPLVLPLLLLNLASSHPTTLQPLQPRDNLSITRNDVLSNLCRPITIIFARGTLELGNVGIFAGPPFFNALSDLVGSSSIAVQGVNYGASIIGYLEGGDPAGAKTMVSLAEQAVAQCPTTQLVLSGYSQGAQIIHNGIPQLPPTILPRILAAVFFGDPDDGEALSNIAANRAQTYCFSDDLICDGLPIVLPAHLGYAADAPSAAGFVAGLLG